MYFGSIIRISRLLALSAAVVAVLIPIPAQAAKVNCTQAVAKLDQMICSDPALARIIERMEAALERALKASANPEALRKEQGEWQENAVNGCDTSACLRQAYGQRTNQLDVIRVQEEQKAKKTGAKPI